MKIKVGIVGAAGYTAGELIRLLANHSQVEIEWIQSESQAGKYVYEIHKDLYGQSKLVFTSELDSNAVDAVFLCKGHGESAKLLVENPDLHTLHIIDLSHDFRRSGDHDFVYGLPELNKEKIEKAKFIANPGCFATCFQLGLLPAVQANVVKSDIHISGVTGSTGAGQSLSETSHFSWRSNNASVYKPLTHQHLLEAGESFIQSNSEFNYSVYFIPYRGAFTRGIVTTSYFDTDVSEPDLMEVYEQAYGTHPFTQCTSINPDVKMVVNTNNCFVCPKIIDGKAVVISVLDNLLKGASGQAVQNMNLIFGLEETTGLQLKASAF